jgi:prepilin-type N-terminal cleavage/methylation domain-containing protein
MEYRNINKKHPGGFTTIEIIAVLIVIGILSAIAVSRIASTQSSSVAVEVDILKMQLRYAQLRALSDDKAWGMSFAGNSYTMLRDGNTAPYNLPNENSPTHTLPSGITVTGNTVTFDEWGSPGTADIPISISPGGRTINITKNTGFIP